MDGLSFSSLTSFTTSSCTITNEAQAKLDSARAKIAEKFGDSTRTGGKGS